jgi:hypothetical protein
MDVPGRPHLRVFARTTTSVQARIAGITYCQTPAFEPAIDRPGRPDMKLCPVALAVGCRKCPVFNMCPAKGIIGDYKKDTPPPSDASKKP